MNVSADLPVSVSAVALMPASVPGGAAPAKPERVIAAWGGGGGSCVSLRNFLDVRAGRNAASLCPVGRLTYGFLPEETHVKLDRIDSRERIEIDGH